MDKFSSVLYILQNHQTILEIGLVALLTAAGEHIFSVVVFECPCNSWNLSYGTMFLLVPALVLLVFGFIISNETWKLFTGLCSYQSAAYDMESPSAFLQVFMQIIARAMVAPVTWIAVALLNGSFYECARTGLAGLTLFFVDHPCSGKPQECVSELHKFPCQKSPVSLPPVERDAVLEVIRSESQVIGWLLIASTITATLLFTCVARCRFQGSYMQRRFWNAYIQKENEVMGKYITQCAMELAERNVTSFFQQEPPEDISIPGTEAWKKTSAFFHFKEEKQLYSALQEYVKSLKKENTTIKL